MHAKLLRAIQLFHRPTDKGTLTYECNALDFIPRDVYLCQQSSGVVRIPTTNLLKSATVTGSKIKPWPAAGLREVADGCWVLK
jgi:hypothetical protein